MKLDISEERVLLILQMFILQHEGKLITDVFPKLRRKNYRHSKLNNLKIDVEEWAHRRLYFVDFSTTNRKSNLFTVTYNLARNGKDGYFSDYFSSLIVTQGKLEDIVKTLSFEDKI